VNGGGQPQQLAEVSANIDIRTARAKALYDIDNKSAVRKAHENPEIKAIYNEYLDKPGSEIAHKLLHTTYSRRGV
jgi:NADP-reducing hydrogenase subunit HndD